MVLGTGRAKVAAERQRLNCMKLYYGWVVVAAGIVVTRIELGTAMSLGVFL